LNGIPVFSLQVLRHGPQKHKNAILAQLAGRVRELVVHAEGSAVLQLAYASVVQIIYRWMDGSFLFSYINVDVHAYRYLYTYLQKYTKGIGRPAVGIRLRGTDYI